MRIRPLVVATFIGVVCIPQAATGFSTEPAQVRCAGLTATIAGTDGDDELVGTAGDDVISGGTGDDVIAGLGGNDVLCGDRGTDQLDGGLGDDRVYGGRNGLQQPYPDNPPDNVGDHLVGGPGDDLLDPGWDVTSDAGGGFIPDQISYADSAAGVHVDLPNGRATGDGADTLVLEGWVGVTGTPYDDVLVSGDEADDLVGGAGDDLLVGGKGRDYLQGDDSDLPSPGAAPYDDRVFGGPGGDGIYLGNGDDEARGGSGDDTISHGSGMADLRAGVGDDDLETRMRFATGAIVDGGPGAGRDLRLVGRCRASAAGSTSVGRIDLGTGVFAMRLGGRTHESTLSGSSGCASPTGTGR